jgi:hypothetical protein
MVTVAETAAQVKRFRELLIGACQSPDKPETIDNLAAALTRELEALKERTS